MITTRTQPPAWEGEAMDLETCAELYKSLCKRYGTDRTRLVVECQPKAVRHTIDNKSDAMDTIDNLRDAKEEDAK